MRIWIKIIMFGLFLGLVFGVAGIASETECEACSGKDVPKQPYPCPYTITLECWCKYPEFNEYLCCSYRTCDQLWPFQPCNICYDWDVCWWWMRCDLDPPESAINMWLYVVAPQ